jgi:hypothetical protein
VFISFSKDGDDLVAKNWDDLEDEDDLDEDNLDAANFDVFDVDFDEDFDKDFDESVLSNFTFSLFNLQ